MNRTRLVAVLVGSAVVGSLFVGSASATFPGDTGAIFAVASSSLPDGGGLVQGWNSPTEFGGEVTDCSNGRAISVAPNGEAIAYSCDIASDSEIFLWELDAGEPTQLTTNDVDDYDPAFSPDGQRLVYSTVNAMENRRLAILDLATLESTLVTPEEGGTFEDWAPAWNPADANEIAYVSTRFSGNPDVVLRDLSDPEGESVPITDNTVDDFGPNYSPDGNQLFFSSEDPFSGIHQIHIYDFGDDSDTTLTSDLTMNSFEPAVSPDGTIVVFSRQEVTVGAEIRLYAMPAEGGTPALLPNQEEGFNYDHAEWQAFGGGSTCPPDCPPPVDDREITLKLKGSLKATGKLTDASEDNRCIDDQKVTIERKKKGKWVKVGSGRTGGKGGYEIKLPNKKGSYRAKAPKVTINDVVDVICSKAISPVRKNN